MKDIFSGPDDNVVMPDDVERSPHQTNSKWWHFKNDSTAEKKKAVCTKEDQACEWATD